MNIRRFVAADMREALAAIRTDLGADAVMLTSRKLGNGVEVIAAIDYDDSLLGAVGGQASTAPRADHSPNAADERADTDARAPAADEQDREQVIAARVAAAREAAFKDAAPRTPALAAAVLPCTARNALVIATAILSGSKPTTDPLRRTIL